MSSTIGSKNYFEAGKFTNDLLGEWTEYKYIRNISTAIRIFPHLPVSEIRGLLNTLVKTEEKVGKIKRARIRVSKFRRKNTVIALRRIFGPLIGNATHILIKGNRLVPITRHDKRVELTRFKDISPGDYINVTLTGVVQTVTDRIPVKEVEFEAYITGEYKIRRINIRGKKVLKVGIKVPEGEDEESFWRNIYNKVKKELFDETTWEGLLMDEFLKSEYIDEADPTSNFLHPGWIWDWNKTKGNFPEDGRSMREKIR